MTARNQHAPESFDEQTLPEPDPTRRPHVGDIPARELCVLDFKSSQTTVAVTHGLADPSRICVALRSPMAVLHLTLEEEVGRDIAEGLARALSTFRVVRSRLR